MAEESKEKKVKVKVIVAPKTSIYTNRGVAHHPAVITGAMLKGGSSEFYKLLKLGKLQREEPLTKNLAEGTQLNIDLFGSGEPGEPGEPDDSGQEKGPPERKGGAKRKNK